MGGKGGDGEPQSSKDLAKIAMGLYTQTDPLRQALIGRSSAFLGVPSAQAPASSYGGGADLSGLMDSLRDEGLIQTDRKGRIYVMGPDPRSMDDQGVMGLSAQARFDKGTPVEQILGHAALKDHVSSFALDNLTNSVLSGASPVTAPYSATAPATMSPMLDVTQSPMYQSVKNAAETQYGRARQDILASTPAGGALYGNLANLDLSKADLLTQQTGALAQDELNRAFSLATGMPMQAMSGLGNAGLIQAQMANQEAQRNASAKQGLGQAAGTAIGWYFGGPAGGAVGGQIGGGAGSSAGSK